MTAIEWTEKTWNPVTGCDRLSPGCDHCYALTLARRLKAMGQPHYQADGDPRTSGPGFGVTVHPDALDLPFRWRKPQRVFVNSMSDLFHRSVASEFIHEVWATMAATERHTYQVLTKRPHRMRLFCERRSILPNVWLGTSIESDRYSFRADHLRATPASVRFLSCEPLLGPLPSLNLDGIDWVIVGGESGPGARPMWPNWAQDIRDRCIDAGIALFFKQWGSWVPYEMDAQPPFWSGQDGEMIDGHHLPVAITDHEPVGGWWWPDPAADYVFRRRPKNHRLLDGRTWDQYPGQVKEGSV